MKFWGYLFKSIRTTPVYWAFLFTLLSVTSRAFQQNLYDFSGDQLPGASQLTFEGNLSYHLLNQAHEFADKKISYAIQSREQYWNRDFSSPEKYQESIKENRNRLKKYLGIIDNDTASVNYNPALPQWKRSVSMEKYADASGSTLVAETPTYRVFQVRWPVLERVYGEGLWVQPKSPASASIIVLPDADQTPEQLLGLAPGIAPVSQFARKLAENGLEIIIPVLIDRQLVHPDKNYNQTRREWIYRQAFHMGRHILGYEIEKVRAAVDWIKITHGPSRKVGIAGYLEGGLVAFYAAALDQRIDATLVSGYFGKRERVWEEPIYRNIWGLLSEFGDAEIAGMIAPNPLIVEYSEIPEVWDGARPDSTNLYRHSGYKGHFKTPSFQDVNEEFERINSIVNENFQLRKLFANSKKEPVKFGSNAPLEAFVKLLGLQQFKILNEPTPTDLRRTFNPETRQIRQLQELNDHIQWLLRVSDYERNRFFLHKLLPQWADKPWSTRSYHPYQDPSLFIEKSKSYREYFAKEIIGQFDDPLNTPNPRSRKVYDEKLWVGYEVMLDVYEGLSTAGVILLPKNMAENEKRPVVVLQHGRNGVPANVIEGNTSYYNMGAVLADKGFIVFVPYGLYNGEDRYRWLSRKGNAIKNTLFSFVLSQHNQLINWLHSLPYVDDQRIAFYGKSYGGEMAMRIPAILKGYCLSVCSGDFGDWSRKVVDTYFPRGFMNSFEWEMPYFDMGSTFSYAEMAYLIFPRPFMVERGRHDTVQPDEWVAFEFAKVSHFYDQFGLKDKTDIEFFNGGHASRNEGVIQFLHKHLNWP